MLANVDFVGMVVWMFLVILVDDSQDSRWGCDAETVIGQWSRRLYSGRRLDLLSTVGSDGERAMGRGSNHDKELAQIKAERERLDAQRVALAERESAALAAQARHSSDLLADAFGKGSFGIVNKAQARDLAKRIAALGIDETLARLQVSKA